MMHGPINISFFLVFLSLHNILKLTLEHFIFTPIPDTHLTDSSLEVLQSCSGGAPEQLWRGFRAVLEGLQNSCGGGPELLWKEWKTEKAIFQPGIKPRFPGDPGCRLVTLVTVLHSPTFQ